MYVLGDASLVAPVLLLQQLVITPIALAVLDLSRPGARGPWWSRLTAPLRNPVVIGSLGGVAVAATGWLLDRLGLTTPPAPAGTALAGTAPVRTDGEQIEHIKKAIRAYTADIAAIPWTQTVQYWFHNGDVGGVTPGYTYYPRPDLLWKG